MADSPQIHTIVSMPFAETTYVVWLEGRTLSFGCNMAFHPLQGCSVL